MRIEQVKRLKQLEKENAREAAVVSDVDVFPVKNLVQVIAFLNKELSISPFKYDLEEALKESSSYEMDFSEVKGQEYVKRALEIAAAGSHNILMLWSQYGEFELIRSLIRG